MKINAIDYRSNIVTKIDEPFSPLQLLLFVMRSKCDVMHRSRSDTPSTGIGQAKQVNNSAGRAIVRRCEPKPVFRFLDQTVTECISEQTRRLFVTFQSSDTLWNPRSACSGGTGLSGHCSIWHERI